MNLKENPAVVWLAAGGVLLIAIAAVAAEARTPWPITLTAVGGLVLASVVTVALLVRFGFAWAAIAAIAAAAGAFALSSVYLPNDRRFVFATGLALALAAVFVTAALVRLSEVLHRLERLRAALGGAMPETTIRSLAREPRLMEPDTRSVTYLHVRLGDTAETTAAALVAEAQQLLHLGNSSVLANKGTLDRRSAGSFGAFWNAPMEDTAAAVHACAAALDILQRGAADTDVGAAQVRRNSIAIASGEAVAASFGSGPLAYSVLGPCVEEAESLARSTWRYGYGALADAATAKDAAHAFALLQVDYDPRPVYALLGGQAVRTSPKFRALQTFHEHIFAALRAQEWRKAHALIEQCRKLSGAIQTLYDLHLARIAEREREGNPPQPSGAAALPGAANP